MAYEGPSGDEIAKVVKRNDLLRRMELEAGTHWKKYCEAQEYINKHPFAGIYGLIPMALFSICVFSFIFNATFGFESETLISISTYSLMFAFVSFVFYIIIGSNGRVAVDEKLKIQEKILDEFEEHYYRKSKLKHEELVEKVDELKRTYSESVRVGKIIVNSPDVAINVGSGSAKIIKNYESKNHELSEALIAILGCLENSKNKEAAVYFDKFTEQLKTEKPDKVICKSLWDSIIQLAPSINNMTSVVNVIAKWFTM